MRTILALLVLFLASCNPWSWGTGYPQTVDQVAMMEQETVILYEDDALHCAGVFIGPHTILTANHCVRHAGMDQDLLTSCRDTEDEWPGCKDWNPVGRTEMYRSMDMSRELGARVTAHDRDKDIALLDTGAMSTPTWSTVSLYGDVQDGQELHVVGHPGGIEWSYVHGYVSSAHKPHSVFDTEVDWMQVSAPIWRGNSGGAAFDTMGRVVGICSWVPRVPGIGYFVPLRTIQDFTRGRVR